MKALRIILIIVALLAVAGALRYFNSTEAVLLVGCVTALTVIERQRTRR